MAQEQVSQDKDGQDSQTSSDKKKEKDHTPTKVVMRRLPPSLTPEQFLEQVSPLPDYDFFYFVRADMSLGPNAFSRAYINFLLPEDIFIFRNKFDGYVFLDAKGGEYPALVEFSPFQKVPKKKPKRADSKIGTIEHDIDYKKFLDQLANPPEAAPVSLDAMVCEVEAKENNVKPGLSNQTTPLLEYLRRRREERKLNIARLKEERRSSGRDRGDTRSDSKRNESHMSDREKRTYATEKEDRLRDRDRRRERRERAAGRDRRRDGGKGGQREERGEGKRWMNAEEEAAPSRQTVMLLKNPDREKQREDREKRQPPRFSQLEKERREGGGGDRGNDEDQHRPKDKVKEDEDRDYKGRPPRQGGRGGGRIAYDEREGSDRKFSNEKDRNRYRDERGGGDRKDNRGVRSDDRRGSGRYRDEQKGGGDYPDKKFGDRKGVGGDRDDRRRGGAYERDDRKGPSYRDDRRGGADRDDRRGGADRDDRRGGADRDDRRGGGDRDDRRGGADRDDRRGDWGPNSRKGGGSSYKDDKRGGGAYDSHERRGGGRGGGADRGDRRPIREGGTRDERQARGQKGGDYYDEPPRRRDDAYDKRKYNKDSGPIDRGSKGSNRDDTRVRSKEPSKEDASKDGRGYREEKESTTRGKLSQDSTSLSSKVKEERPRSSAVSTYQEGVDDDKGEDGDEKKRKRKDRPERQIYIPRRALERQKQGDDSTKDQAKDAS